MPARSEQEVSDLVGQRPAHHAPQNAVLRERRPFVDAGAHDERRRHHRGDRVRVQENRRRRRSIDEIDRAERILGHVPRRAVRSRNRQRESALRSAALRARLVNRHTVRGPDRRHLFHRHRLELRGQMSGVERDVDREIGRRDRVSEQIPEKGEGNRRHRLQQP